MNDRRDDASEYWTERQHRAGGDGRSERFESARQRTIVLTFDSAESAQAWDDAGQPVVVGRNEVSA